MIKPKEMSCFDDEEIAQFRWLLASRALRKAVSGRLLLTTHLSRKYQRIPRNSFQYWHKTSVIFLTFSTVLVISQAPSRVSELSALCP